MPRHRHRSWILLLPLAACGREDPPGARLAPRFPLRDVAAEAGLAFTTTSGAASSTQLLEVKGGGLALFDADGDGDLDVFVPNGATLAAPQRGPGARLFRNEGELRFSDATAASGIDWHRWSFGCAVGDVDADGRDDLFVAAFGRNGLWRAREDGAFEPAGGAFTREAWSTAAAFGDLDGDGDLDLYVANYVRFDPAAPPPPMDFRGARVFGGPMGLPGEADEVYENLGDGTFRDATHDWGFDAVPPSYGLGVLILDLDGDGRAEVFVGNDSQANFLFRRGDDGRFVDVGVQSGLALDENGWGQATMGIAVGDVDADGRPDVFTSNFMADHDTLHVNLGDLRFEDRSRAYGLALETVADLGWGSTFVDLDHDGNEELLVLHGHVYSAATCAPVGWRHDQEPALFARDGQRFARVPAEQGGAWLAEPHCDRGLAWGDLDDDGDVDFVVTELNGPLRLWRNDAASGTWLRVALRDGRPGAKNPRGLGSRVTVRAGEARQTRWIASGQSYEAAYAAEAHFGFGERTAPVALEVRWPDGETQVLPEVALGARVEVVRK